ncbi:MAG TPA: maleylpyruvate isomerase N-terminal domain-containing protein, partial [Acidimicrobiales bacterium]|nr:maleylpyruvate isomerase N-terminal domain-containing protein [Acidimicrobiales bacterium]
MDHVEHCSLLAAEIERFALAIDGLPLDLPVPSCPGWAVSDLTLHLGKVHRWAENLVRLRAPERIPGPRGDLEPTASWVRDGGTALVATLRAADPDAGMWAWGVDQHVRWWSRRQLHETLVHRMDADLAAGAAPRADAAVAADAIDEFLVNLGAAAYFSPKVKELKGDGA